MLLLSHEAPAGSDPVFIWLRQTHTLAMATLLELLLIVLLAKPNVAPRRKGQALAALCCLFTAYRLNLYWQSLKVCSCLGQLPRWFPAIDNRYLETLTLALLAALWFASWILLAPPKARHDNNTTLRPHDSA